MDAPSFEGIGARRHFVWLKEWILDPKAQRHGAQMPRLFHGPTAEAEAEAVAAYLSSLSSTGAAAAFLKPFNPAPLIPGAAESPAAQQEAGKNLIEKLHCAGCHNLPGTPATPGKISLDHLTRKFPGGRLAEFLRAPERHFQWIQMPNFRLTAEESNELAALLVEKLPMFKLPGAPADAATLARGRKLVTSAGCLNCHTLPAAKSDLVGAPLTQLAPAKWGGGCLAEQRSPGSKAPQFRFSAEERAALLAFAATDRKSIERHVPPEFAARQVRALNCGGCHGQVEGFPVIDLVGGKLRPEWTRDLLSGALLDRPRSWLGARMPAFPSRAPWLAPALAQSHGLPPQTPAAPPLDAGLATWGRKLTGVDGGFSCISCHGVAAMLPTQVFEALGINLAFSAARLQPAYYRRWLLNPQRLDPQTKMPLYFDEEGKSPLMEVLDGDAAKQIDALWHYLRLGSKMEPPATQ
jgi:mono/diheme cytochrome c family protein